MKVLIADDDRVSLLYLQDALEEWGYEVLCADDGKTACTLLQQPDGPLLAVIDWMMPGMDGTDICRTVRDTIKDRYIYLIMLTSKSETPYIVEAMNAGADDFVGKPFIAEELQVRVRAGRRICELEHALRIKASSDALTGVYNRGAIIDTLQKEMARHDREQQSLAIIFADLDHFKRVNDQYGHLAGDAVLREVTRRIKTTLRPYDSLGRYGGEELLVVLPACDKAGAAEVAERIRAGIAGEHIATGYGAIAASVSLGVAVLEGGSHVSFNDFIHRADHALYRAKANGRNRIETSD